MRDHAPLGQIFRNMMVENRHKIGIEAAGKSLESISKPLQSR